MIYGGVITTPANTTKAAPLDTTVDVTAGLIYHVKIIFPPGPSGFLHVQVLDGSYQVFPTTQGQSIVGDNLSLEWDELYDKGDAPFVLVVRTWNLDDTYDHDVSVLLSLASKEEYQARYLPMMAQNVMAQAFAVAEAEKGIARQERVKAFLEKIPGEGS